ncbi:MAG: hypothetical protein ACFCU3_09165 [Verrucomicrobiales bacterium]
MRVLASIVTGVFAVGMAGLGVVTLFLLVMILSNFNFGSFAHLGILLFSGFTGIAAVLALPCYLFISSPKREVYIYLILLLWCFMKYLYGLPAARGLIH